MRSILEILIQAKNNATAAFKQLEGEVKGLTSPLDGLNKMLGVFGVAIGATEAVRLGQQLSNAARAANDAKGALNAAVKGITSYQEAMAAAQQATEGMVSRTELASALTTIYGSKLASSAQEAAQLANAGSILTGVFKDAGASMDLYVRLLNSGSRELYNNFGLSQQLVNELQAQIEATTNLSGEEARLEAVRRGLIQTAQQYKSALSEDTVAAKQFEAANADLQAALGQLILPTVTEGMTNLGVVIRGLADTMTELPGPVQAATQGLIDMVSPLTTINALIRDFQGLTGDAASGSDELAGATGSAAEAAQAEAAALGPATSSLDAMGFSAVGAAEAHDPLIRQMAQATFVAKQAAEAYRETAAAAQSQASAAAFGGQQSEFAQQRNLSRLQNASDKRLQYQEEQRRTEEEAARQSEQTVKRQTQTMIKAFDEVGQQISTAVSGAVSGAVGDLAEVWNPGGETDAANGAAQWARRMAAIAAGGLKDEWANPERWANFGGDKSVLQPLFNAISSGDDTAVKAQAQALLANKTADLFDANMIAAQVEQKLRAQQIQQVLNDRVNALLGERGLQAVTNVTQQIAGVATDTQTATTAVGESVAGLGTSAETSAAKIGESFTAAIGPIDTLNARLKLMAGLIERVNTLAGQAAGNIAGMNPPAAPGADAQNKMGGNAPL